MMKKIIAYFPLLLLLLASTCESPSDTKVDSLQEKHQYTNALVDETSPYLLQHAHNPVDWHPWSEKVFEKATQEDKIVLVSIGYSSCHWCHVMEHETFEDSTVAAYMNEHFINIKVDREERPDVDQVYMSAVQLMTGSGGWPLNVFVLPDGRPFYGGTYFKKEKWVEMMKSLIKLRKDEPHKIETYATSVTEGVQQSETVVKVEEEVLFQFDDVVKIVEKFESRWDLVEGGMNHAPKFPMPNNYEFLLQYAELAEDSSALGFVLQTLDKLAQGGIYDQIGGGFARYSTDKKWKVPHFEKMLYDNAQLVSLYSRAYQKTKNPEYEKIIRQTLGFVEREMTSNEKVFYSAYDADSEGEEGKFYIWTKEELKAVLGDDFDFVSNYYNLNMHGKWENGHYILLRKMSDKEFAKKNNYSIKELREKVTKVNDVLLEVRNKREWPGLDDKILTSWNALMVSGYVDAYNALGEEAYLASAISAADFIWENQLQDSALFRTYKNGHSKINGYLEDYSFTIESHISLYQATFDEKWLDRADELMRYTIHHFYDEETGMFWYTSDMDPPLVTRKMELTDNVIPASNSSVAKGLFLLGTYFYKPDYIDMSDQMLKNISPSIDELVYYSNWLSYKMMRTKPFYEIAITGDESFSVRQDFSQVYLVNTCLVGANKQSNLPLLKGKFMDETMVFVCKEGTCLLPVSSFVEAKKQLSYE